MRAISLWQPWATMVDILRKMNPEAVTSVHVRKEKSGYIASFFRRGKKMRKYRVRKANLERLIRIANSYNWFIMLDDHGQGWSMIPEFTHWAGQTIERRCVEAWIQQSEQKE